MWMWGVSTLVCKLGGKLGAARYGAMMLGNDDVLLSPPRCRLYRSKVRAARCGAMMLGNDDVLLSPTRCGLVVVLLFVGGSALCGFWLMSVVWSRICWLLL